jgi:hypothetical protein
MLIFATKKGDRDTAISRPVLPAIDERMFREYLVNQS